MAAVLVGRDSAVVNEEDRHHKYHGTHAYFEHKKVDVTKLNYPTRKMSRKLSGDSAMCFRLLNECLQSWVIQSRCRDISVEDVLIGYCQHVLEMSVDDIANIVQLFHTWRVSLTSDRRAPLPRHVWLKVLKSRSGHGPMGLDEKFYLEVD